MKAQFFKDKSVHHLRNNEITAQNNNVFCRYNDILFIAINSFNISLLEDSFRIFINTNLVKLSIESGKEPHWIGHEVRYMYVLGLYVDNIIYINSGFCTHIVFDNQVFTNEKYIKVNDFVVDLINERVLLVLMV